MGEATRKKKSIKTGTSSPSRASLICADSVTDADMLYATGVFVPDPFLFVQCRGRRYVLVSDLELARVRREARVHRVYAYREALELDPARETRGRGQGIDRVCTAFLRHKQVERVQVPETFPLGLADTLREAGFRVEPKRGAFFPQRSRKSEQEVKELRKVLRATEHAMRTALNALRASRVDPRGKGTLVLGAERLSSERLRGLIHRSLMERGCSASHTIVACGRQGSDPHQTGRGPLRADRPIILDIFPRSERSGYYGDMTRTVVKGKASEKVRSMHAAVRAAQKQAFEALGPAVRADKVHGGLVELFRQRGFPTGQQGGRPVGFIHGTGHGLGLEIHEAPRISTQRCRLQAGNVVTVEPGLYYPDVGGVRLEDVVLITPDGVEKLTGVGYTLEIP